ncbi:hypothetical protein [Aromatoleum aromaticum]|uniref:hypothetical protein n=1 Tax=Aromatoleum aromaticum TaxID=551760 RepID=UPI0005A2B040|nr:hypothetical protein [Aromatoleum aromaticum]NMG56587.1 hypothetical protein [Aromatoleum aromaticum]
MTDAGVSSEDLTMVFHSGGYWLSRKAEDTLDMGPSMWDAPFISMALWWELATLGLTGSRPEAPSRRRCNASPAVVVPLNIFEERRLRRRGN